MHAGLAAVVQKKGNNEHGSGKFVTVKSSSQDSITLRLCKRHNGHCSSACHELSRFERLKSWSTLF
jgi:hypothetical protein